MYAIAGAYLKGIRNCYKWWIDTITDLEFRGRMFESIIMDHLSRKYGFVYYWYSSNLKREIDLLVKSGGDILLYEVKSQTQTTKPFMGKEVKVITPTNLFEHI